MCLEPVTLATLALSTLSAVGQYEAQSEAADQQERQNENQRKALLMQRDGERMDAERAQQAAYEAAASSTNEHAHQAMKDLAYFDAISGESGGGVTSQRKAAAIGIANGQDQATIASNAQKQQVEIGFGDFASANRAKAGIDAIQSVRKPSLLQAGLTIAGNGLSAYTKDQQIKSLKGNQ
jgi:hypothetical protein